MQCIRGRQYSSSWVQHAPEGDGYAKPGEECDLDAEDESLAPDPPSRLSAVPGQTTHTIFTGSDGVLPEIQIQNEPDLATSVPSDPDIPTGNDLVDTSQLQSSTQYRPEFLSFLGVAGVKSA